MGNWKKIKYGYVLVAVGLAITGTTIYQVGRQRIKAVDVIELTQATVERYMAAGRVDEPGFPTITLPSFPLLYYTSIVMTNLGYDTTNIVILTNKVTISNIIDGIVVTNHFFITNDLVTTNVVVLVGTNFATNRVTFVTTNSYRLKNAIGHRVKTVFLNALDNSIIEIVPYFVDTNTVYDGMTNIVMHTFTGLLASLNLGDGTNFTPYGWRTSTNELRERYAVLEQLRVTKISWDKISSTHRSKEGSGSSPGTWEEVKSKTESDYINAAIQTNDVGGGEGAFFFRCWTRARPDGGSFRADMQSWQFMLSVTNINTNIFHSVEFYARAHTAFEGDDVYDDNSLGLIEDVWNLVGIVIDTNSSFMSMTNFFGQDIDTNQMPVWTDVPTDGWVSRGVWINRAFVVRTNVLAVINWTSSANGFQYATNTLN